MSNKTTKFMNAQQMAVKYPNTFDAPSAERLATIAAGVSVKVCPETGDEFERFWVVVTKVSADGNITGMVDNELILTHLHGYEYGDTISFLSENVYDVMTDADWQELHRVQNH